MSKGPGRVERSIAAILDAAEGAFTVDDLAQRIYGQSAEKKHRVAIIRAGKRLATRRPEVTWFRAGTNGGPFIFYRADRAASFAELRLRQWDLWRRERAARGWPDPR
jgi:hypothetical protein